MNEVKTLDLPRKRPYDPKPTGPPVQTFAPVRQDHFLNRQILRQFHLEGIPFSGSVIGHTTARSFPTSRNGTPCRTKDPTSTSRTLLDLLMATTASSRALGETMVGRLQAGSSPAWGRKWTKTKSSASEALMPFRADIKLHMQRRLLFLWHP